MEEIVRSSASTPLAPTDRSSPQADDAKSARISSPTKSRSKSTAATVVNKLPVTLKQHGRKGDETGGVQIIDINDIEDTDYEDIPPCPPPIIDPESVMANLGVLAVAYSVLERICRPKDDDSFLDDVGSDNDEYDVDNSPIQPQVSALGAYTSCMYGCGASMCVFSVFDLGSLLQSRQYLANQVRHPEIYRSHD